MPVTENKTTEESSTTPTTEPVNRVVSESEIRLEYHDRISGNITEAKLWRFGFKKGFKITSIDFSASDFKTADALAKQIVEKFGVRYVYLRPAVFSIEDLLKLSDLPNYI